MSVAGDILTKMELDIPTILGSGYKQLDYVYEIEKNSLRSGQSAWGAAIGPAATTDGVNKAVTKDHEFRVVIAKNFENRSKDKGFRAALKSAYDAVELLDKNFFQKKLNLANSVLVVSELSSDEPEIISKTLYLTIRYTIKYRFSTI